jgi:hypothetical protein
MVLLKKTKLISFNHKILEHPITVRWSRFSGFKHSLRHIFLRMVKKQMKENNNNIPFQEIPFIVQRMGSDEMYYYVGQIIPQINGLRSLKCGILKLSIQKDPDPQLLVESPTVTNSVIRDLTEELQNIPHHLSKISVTLKDDDLNI